MPNVQNKNRSSNNTRIQDAGATLAHNKVLKQVSSKLHYYMRYYIFASKIHIVWIAIACCKFLMYNDSLTIILF